MGAVGPDLPPWKITEVAISFLSTGIIRNFLDPRTKQLTLSLSLPQWDNCLTGKHKQNCIADLAKT